MGSNWATWLLLPCRYTVKVHPDFGPYLLSVNGLFGQSTEKTYWQLLVKRLGHLESLTVGKLTWDKAYRRKNYLKSHFVCIYSRHWVFHSRTWRWSHLEIHNIQSQPWWSWRFVGLKLICCHSNLSDDSTYFNLLKSFGRWPQRNLPWPKCPRLKPDTCSQHLL